MKFLLKPSQKIVQYLERQHLPLANYIFTFLSAIMLRNFFEGFSQARMNYFNLPPEVLFINFSHFTLSYISGAISLLLLLYYAVQRPLLEIARVILPCFIILLLPPALDLLISGGKGQDILYLGHSLNASPLKLFLTFFGDSPGITFGMRTEIVIGLFGIFCYIYIKREKWLVASIYTLLAYQLIFLYSAFPVLLRPLGFFLQHSFSLRMIQFYAVLILPTGLWLSYLANPRIFLAIIHDLRWLRILHYQLMMVLGIGLAMYYSPFSLTEMMLHLKTDAGLSVIFCMISIIFAGLFSIVTNNIADLAIDRVSNPSRPLITGAIELQTYSAIGFVSLSVALSYALLAGLKAFILILVIVAAYYIYSVPPLRCKQIPLFSKFIIALNSLVLIMLGFILVNQTVRGFPQVLIPIYLIGFTMSSNFIDLKDYAGDLQGKVMTLPGLIGLKKARILISVAFFLTYLSFYFLLNELIILPLLALGGGIQMYLINKNYPEKINFLFYLMSMVVLIGNFFIKVMGR